MKLFKLLLLTLAITGLVSCSKSSDTDTGGGTGSIAAKTELNVAYGADPRQTMDIYLPANRNSATTKVLIYIHGGGWISGDKGDLTAADIDTLKKRIPDYAIFNINYRLAAFPATNTFPAQELDVKAAVEFIFGNRNNYQVSDKFVLMGGSAGGHLALLHAYKYPTPVKIKAVVDFFGPTDMVDLYNNPGSYPAASIALLMNGTPAGNPVLYQQSSPINFVSATTCPTIILQGDMDLLVNATTQSRALQTRLNTAAVVNQYEAYPLLGHGPWDAATNTDAFNKIQVFLAANVQ
ncbi:MAG: alpha/beta hydrolase [Chitinophagaceae bacterium]|nr:alpha/beta hydrolase [Chitinophagaceae bacterium]